MALRCTVCDHENRAAINSLLASGAVSNRGIASQFGLNRAAIDRHAINHLPAKLAKAVQRAEIKEEDEFLDSIRATARSMAAGVDHGMQAAEDGLIDPEMAYRMAPAMAAQRLRALELLGNATGRLNQPQGAAGATNVYLSVVLPRGDQLEQPAIEVQALPAADPDTLPE